MNEYSSAHELKNVGISNKKLCVNEHGYCIRNHHTVKHSINLDNPFLIASYWS